MNIYNINVLNKEGQETNLSEYKGKVMLIVNTATGCGLTPQYEGLQNLYEKYQEKGFVVLDFPCNQFGKQAPGTIEEISEFCSLKYHTTFPIYAKIDVNGDNQSELFAYLKKQKGGLLSSKIKWNFTKFLVDQNGTIIKRYAPTIKPEVIEKDLINLLK